MPIPKKGVGDKCVSLSFASSTSLYHHNGIKDEHTTTGGPYAA